MSPSVMPWSATPRARARPASTRLLFR
jgi:hypothetical protein